jgi:hypothetical protein
MGRPAPKWFAELIDLEPEQWYTAPRLAKKYDRSSANIRIVLSRRIPPTYRQIRGEIFAAWLGEDLAKLGNKYIAWRKGKKDQASEEELPAP